MINAGDHRAPAASTASSARPPRRAVKAFQQAKGLGVTGTVDAATAAALGAGRQRRRRGRPPAQRAGHGDDRPAPRQPRPGGRRAPAGAAAHGLDAPRRRRRDLRHGDPERRASWPSGATASPAPASSTRPRPPARPDRRAPRRPPPRRAAAGAGRGDHGRRLRQLRRARRPRRRPADRPDQRRHHRARRRRRRVRRRHGQRRHVVPAGQGPARCPARSTPPRPPPSAWRPRRRPAAAPAVNVQLEAKPVQGPCYYGDTWSAARGNGRIHLGVDIVAAEGNQLYAVATGTDHPDLHRRARLAVGQRSEDRPARRHVLLLRPPVVSWPRASPSARPSPPDRSSATSGTPATPSGRTCTSRSTRAAARPSTRIRSSRRSEPAEPAETDARGSVVDRPPRRSPSLRSAHFRHDG